MSEATEPQEGQSSYDVGAVDPSAIIQYLQAKIGTMTGEQAMLMSANALLKQENAELRRQLEQAARSTQATVKPVPRKRR